MAPIVQQSSYCHLLELPPELRLEIYDFLFPDEDLYAMDLISFNTREGTMYTLTAPRGQLRCMGKATALLSACREINGEATPVFYRSLMFSIAVGGLDHVFEVPRLTAWELTTFPAFYQMRTMEVWPTLARFPRPTQARLVTQIDALVDCVNGLPRLECLDVDLYYDDSTDTGDFEDLMAALSRIRSEAHIETSIHHLYFAVPGFDGRCHLDMARYHAMVEAVGG